MHPRRILHLLQASFWSTFSAGIATATITVAHDDTKANHDTTKTEPVKVYILCGQSNMEGKAKISLMEFQATQLNTSGEFQHYRTETGEWKVRDDVWIKFLDRKGKLTVGFGSPGRIGPELEFGERIGNQIDQQVLIIKTAWGGKSLFRDFRSPSAGLPGSEVLEQLLERAQRKNSETTLEEVKDSFGLYYREMLAEISDSLKNLGKYFPDYRGQGYEIAGFVWFQGWNDMVNKEYTAAYEQNMIQFIRDVRHDLGVPNLPFVIGQLGVGGTTDEKPNPNRETFKAAQAAAGKLDEFRGNVAVVKTDVYWDDMADAVYRKGWKEHLGEWEKVGSDRPYHYLGSPRTYCGIGGAFADAILDLSRQNSN